MESRRRYVAVTIDSAEDGAFGDVRSGQPFAQRPDRARILVLAKRDRDLVAGLLLVGLRARHADHKSGG